MKLHRLSRTYILDKAGINTAKIVSINGTLKWEPVMILPASGLPEKAVFIKSVMADVNENSKRAHFMAMIDAIFSGMMLDDFSKYFANSVVKYKVAHSFKHAGKTENLRELKHGNKDRIYLYPYTGKMGRFVFFFEAAHKNQQQTETAVKERAEELIKKVIEANL
ncbi:hypothetical protein [Pseudomonas wadenswilerensis]|uniref:Uncharacterized protein n=1 Tax=Pseudomonas wadenswilerensis TaxID=1785161 RepID=A0A380T497_9PSED|nr:hypothetical protein [Pseudomonas wadenswilerensis]SUQ64775.1 hypothetical protein CCOS864_04241 [Pseudomonas wadenswilerensis]